MGGECCSQNVEGQHGKGSRRVRLQEMVRSYALLAKSRKITEFADPVLLKQVQEKVGRKQFNPALISEGNLIEVVAESGDKYYYQGQAFELLADKKASLTGNGSMMTKEGLFVGVIEDGVPSDGVVYLSNGRGEFRGSYSNSQPGKGVYKCGNLVYQGSYFNSKKHGHGKQTNGKYQFEGEYQDGEILRGKYTMNKEQPDVFFKGDFRAGKPVLSTGVFHVGDLKITEAELNEAGQIVKGRVKYRNGDWYRGDLLDGLRHGQGQYNSEHQYYGGKFRQNCRHGPGILRRDSLSYKVVYNQDKITDIQLAD